eukprot:323971-Prymnesium_polylepis.1
MIDAWQRRQPQQRVARATLCGAGDAPRRRPFGVCVAVRARRAHVYVGDAVAVRWARSGLAAGHRAAFSWGGGVAACAALG